MDMSGRARVEVGALARPLGVQAPEHGGPRITVELPSGGFVLEAGPGALARWAAGGVPLELEARRRARVGRPAGRREGGPL